MTVNRTTLLDLPLPVTGTESGTWGDTTNNGLTQYLDIAIAGTLVLSTDADVTLTSTEGDSSATNIGATTAQYAILRWTATGSTTRNITALAQSKTYVVINATGGTQSIVLRGAGPTTGVTIISGEKAFCVWNGSDFVKVSSSAAAGGSNTQVQYNSSGVLAGSSNLTFDGTSLTLGGNPTLSAGTANGVLYLNGSKVATSGSGLVFDSSGNLGLGVTPSGGGGGVPQLQFGNVGSVNSLNQTDIMTNAKYDSGYKYAQTGGYATSYTQVKSTGSHVWFNAPSGTAGNAITFTQAMTLDASGNLIVGGTTTPSGKANNFINEGGSGGFWTKSGGVGYFGTFDNYAMILATNDTERARITSGGEVLIGATAIASYFDGKLNVAGRIHTKIGNAADSNHVVWNEATSGDNGFVLFGTEATYTGRGSIDYNRAGGLTRYNTTSDYRAKDIIGPVQNPGATIDALKVYEGVMKGATQARPMLIAHEAQAHAPYAVSGVKDEVNEDGTPKFQQIDVSSLVPLLLAEIQSLRQRVALLEGN